VATSFVSKKKTASSSSMTGPTPDGRRSADGLLQKQSFLKVKDRRYENVEVEHINKAVLISSTFGFID
jgi:hypothetical protein